MRIQAIELHAFRNLASVYVEPHPRFTVLSGDNAQGKTNFLEAVFLLGALRSFRATRLEELVGFAPRPEIVDQPRPPVHVHDGSTSDLPSVSSTVLDGPRRALARARVERGGLERLYEVEVTADPPRKTARVDGKAVRAAAEYFGGFNVVLFAPDDLRLPRGSPSGRRRFVDRAVWNAEPAFLHDAQVYEKTLRSRNALLRDGAPASQMDDLLDVYDTQLAEAGAAIVGRRRRYVAALAPRAAAAWERITQSGLDVSLAYETATPVVDAELAGALRSLFLERRRRDLATGYTTAGPHTDDLELAIDGRPARLYASQGQLRALMLALKIAEIQHLLAVLDDAPILLLDDVSSELDPARNAFLFAFLRDVECQVFITTTHPSNVRLSSDRRDRLDLTVSAGKITQHSMGA